MEQSTGLRVPVATPGTRGVASHDLISQNVFSESFFKSEFPHKSTNFFFISVIVKER
jgi:hypothetical protein